MGKSRQNIDFQLVNFLQFDRAVRFGRRVLRLDAALTLVGVHVVERVLHGEVVVVVGVQPVLDDIKTLDLLRHADAQPESVLDGQK